MKNNLAQSKGLLVLYLFWAICFFLILMPSGGKAAYYTVPLATRGGHLGDGRQLNDKGQVVWSSKDFGSNFAQIYFYDGTTTKQITDDAFDNGWIESWKYGGLDLNQQGEFVWIAFENAPVSMKIKSYKDGVIKQINNSNFCFLQGSNITDNFPRINNNGDVVWTQKVGTGSEVFLYSNNIVQQITNTGSYNYHPRINDNRDITWSSHKGEDNWGLYLLSLGISKLIYDTMGSSQGYININNQGKISFMELATYDNYIFDGSDVIKLSTAPGNGYFSFPYINSNGHVIWLGYYNTEIFIYDGSTVKKLTGTTSKKMMPNFNDSGQVVWSGTREGLGIRTITEIYLYNNGNITTVFQETHDRARDIRNLQINNKCQIIWEDRGDWYLDSVIYLAIPTDQPIISASRTSLINTSTRGVNPPNQDFEVWNSGDETLNCTITADVPWLTCIPDTAMSTGDHTTITVNYLSSNLDYGTHNGNLIITDANAINNPIKISVSLTINETSLNGALDNSKLTFLTDGNAQWFPELTTYYYKGSAAQSGHILDLGSTILRTTVHGPGCLTFYWKVDSELNADYLRLYMDGSPQGSISGAVDWQEKALAIPGGNHLIEWVYTKDSNVSMGKDCGWVDKVFYQPGGSYNPSVFLLLLD